MKWLRRVWPYALLVILVAINVSVWVKRDAIADWWRLRDYSAPADIAALATDTTMNDLGKHYFYINHPVLEDKQAFNAHCADHGEETAVLGCYHGDRRGIYLYAVTDERLAGVRQVTAAHEMLHQAYDRLDGDEKRRVNKMLDDFYGQGQITDAIKAKIDSYRSEGADLGNEMHSIFGSEVRELSAELETYYKRYFVDRAKIVEFAEAYQGEFTRRKELVKQYDAQLDGLKKQINDNKSTLEGTYDALESKENEIEADVAARDQAAYENDVREYNQMVNQHNSLLATTRGLIEQYNQIVKERNAIEVQEHELQEALDSRLTPAQQEQ